MLIISYRLLISAFTVLNLVQIAKCQQTEKETKSSIQYCLLKENNNLRGVCTRISQCSLAKNNLERFKPNSGNICYWDNLEPIVCCQQDQELDMITERNKATGLTHFTNSKLPNNYFPTQTFTLNPMQQKQIYVTINTFRDENKPISVRPPFNYIISQTKNPILTTSLIKRKDSLPNYTTSSSFKPVVHSENFFNQLHTTTKPPINYEQKEKWKENNNQDDSRNSNRNNSRRNNQSISNQKNKENDKINNNENRRMGNDEDSSSQRNSKNKTSRISKLPKCGKRVNPHNFPAMRIVKGDQAKESEFPFAVAVYIVQSDSYNRNNISSSNKTANMQSSKRKRGNVTNSNSGLSNPKVNNRKTIRNLLRNHLFGFQKLNYPFLKRSKRFLSSIYPSYRSTYYSTRPIHKSSSFDSINLSRTYRTVPLRTSNRQNPLLKNERVSSFYNVRVGSPMNSPIVNINPSIDPSNKPSISNENSNADIPSSTMTKKTTTPSPLSTNEDDNNDDSDSKLKQECGGSIISTKYILSAAHCFENFHDPSRYIVGVGSNSLKNLKMYSVKRIHIHPQYSSKYFYHDVAILELEEKLKFDDSVQPVCLPDRDLLRNFNLDEVYLGKETDEETFEERKSSRKRIPSLVVDSGRNPDSVDPNSVVVVGWGSLKYQENKSTDKLRKAHLKLVKHQEDCDVLFRKLRSSSIPDGITNSMVCAHGSDPNNIDVLSDDEQENTNADACQNDSGGPLLGKLSGNKNDINRLPDKYSSFVNFDSKPDDDYEYGWVQIGITSFGYRCGTNYPGVYSNTASYFDWINSIIN